MSTISPNASAQFGKARQSGGRDQPDSLRDGADRPAGHDVQGQVSAGEVYLRNTRLLLIAVAYSLYALHACGKDAVFGGALVLAFGYLLYGFLAKRFADVSPTAQPGPTTLRPGFQDSTDI